MQTTARVPLTAFCLLLALTALYAGFLCFQLLMGQDVRPDVAVWSILSAMVLLGASAARNAALRARASRSREGGGLGGSAYARLAETTKVRIDEGRRRRWGESTPSSTSTNLTENVLLQASVAMACSPTLSRRAGEVSPDAWTSEERDAALSMSDQQLIATAQSIAHYLSYNDSAQSPAKHVLNELALRFSATTAVAGAAVGPLGEAEIAAIAAVGPSGVFVDGTAGEAEEDEASPVPPRMPGDGDEMLVQIVEELDDMLGEAIADPEGIAPASWRDIGRTWRDLCQALGVVQPTYAHQAPDHWDATPEHDYDDAIEAAGPAMHEAAGG